MSDIQVYYIPKNLDEPPRWLFWSMDEAIILLCPIGMGIILGFTFWGFLLGVGAFLGWKRIKGNDQANLIIYMIYWYFPSVLIKLKYTPPSYNRMFLM